MLCFLVKTEGICLFPLLQDHLKPTDFTAEQTTLKRMRMYVVIQLFKVIT